MDPKQGIVDEDVEISSGEIIFVGEDNGLRGFAERHDGGKEEGTNSP